MQLKFFFAALLAPAFPLFAQGPVFSDHISDSRINVITQDRDGYIWFGTAHGLNRFNGSNYLIYYGDSSERGLQNDNILEIMVDTGNGLHLGTEGGGIFFDGNNFYNSSGQIAYNPVNFFYEVGDGTEIAMGRGGFIKMPLQNSEASDFTMLARYSPAGSGWLEHISVSKEKEIWSVRSSRDSTLLEILDLNLVLKASSFLGKDIVVSAMGVSGDKLIIAADKQVLYYNTRTHSREPLPPVLKKITGGKTVKIIEPYGNDCFLIGFHNEGFYSYNPEIDAAEHIIPEETLDKEKYICFVDKDKNIWLADGESPVTLYPERRPYGRLFSGGSRSSDINALVIDKKDRLWMIRNNRLMGMDVSMGEQIFESSQDAGRYTFIYLDSGQNLWAIKDRSCAEVWDIRTNVPRKLKDYWFDDNIDSIGEMQDGTIVIPVGMRLAFIMSEGEVRIEDNSELIAVAQTQTHPGSGRTFMFTINSGLKELLPNKEYRSYENQVMANLHSLVVAQDGSLWLASYSKGLYHFVEKGGIVESYTINEGLVDNNVKSVIEDNFGNIWFSTSAHIMKYDIREHKFSVIHDANYNEGFSYSRNCAAKGADGVLYFGGSAGITIIHPDIALSYNRDIPLRLDRITSGDLSFPAASERIDLQYKNNLLTLRFSGLDYDGTSLLNYAYMLEGYQSDWVYTNAPGPVNYSFLPSGKYTFRVRVREQGGVWSPHEILLPIVIHPAPWASPLAKMLYVILALLFIATIIYVLTRMRTQQERLALSAQREEIQQQHIDFVTNISHEFRTPLTMIYAPVKELTRSDNIAEREMRLVETISRNAERLRTLSDQILDSGKGSSVEKLMVRKSDLSMVVKSISDNYSFAIHEKDQNLLLLVPEVLMGYCDIEKFCKIYSNLLSNAIKYTPNGGHITVRLKSEGQHAVLTVADDGIGIAEEMRPRLFSRYDRLGAKESDNPGSGIGLNYAKRLADICLSDLTFAPNLPNGSVFSLTMPVQRLAYPENAVSYEKDEYVFPKRTPIEQKKEKNGSLLIVEDSAEIRNFLYDILSDDYHVLLAEDGIEALDHLHISLPDLVLSDIIMPGKNGYELCEQIKTHPDWGHTPVILLTAKGDSKSGAEGFRRGADAYIPKPFDPDYLKAAIDSLVGNRRRIQQRLANLTSSSPDTQSVHDESSLNNRERILLKRIHDTMDDNLENEDFNVEEMCRQLNMSYSSLYAKMKDLMGTTPVQYLITYRMNRAQELLKTGNYTVSEVSYKIGVSSLSQFSKMFKKHFGVTPSQLLPV